MSLYQCDPFQSFPLYAEKLFESLSTPAFHSYASAILAVLCGAFAAFLYTRHFEKKKAQRSLISEFSADLREIDELCQLYWMGDRRGKVNKKTLNNVGHSLTAKLRKTDTYRPLIERMMREDFVEFDSLDSDLFMLATGGDFQTAHMRPCPNTYLEISNTITQIELILRKLRRA